MSAGPVRLHTRDEILRTATAWYSMRHSLLVGNGPIANMPLKLYTKKDRETIYGFWRPRLHGGNGLQRHTFQYHWFPDSYGQPLVFISTMPNSLFSDAFVQAWSQLSTSS